LPRVSPAATITAWTFAWARTASTIGQGEAGRRAVGAELVPDQAFGPLELIEPHARPVGRELLRLGDVTQGRPACPRPRSLLDDETEIDRGRFVDQLLRGRRGRHGFEIDFRQDLAVAVHRLGTPVQRLHVAELLSILEIIGVEPKAFFAELYGPAKAETSRAELAEVSAVTNSLQGKKRSHRDSTASRSTE
jgi:hypothetical protein